MNRLASRLGLAAFQILLTTNAWGQATCDIEPQTRQFIESVLCGQASQDEAYRQYGSGCFERSVTKRLEDSALQILLYEKCGDSEFAAELRHATVRAMKFMEELSVCVSENVELETIMRERMKFVKRKASPLTCTSNRRAMLQRRRPAFEEMIQKSIDFDQAAILETIGVVIDENGSVLDR